MKALAILATCLAVASPALAARGGAPHVGPAPHPGPAHPQGHGMMDGGHDRHGQGGGNVFYDPFGPEVLSTYPTNVDAQPAPADLPPAVVELPPAPYCPPIAAAPPRMRHTGPRIIYIGHQPTVNGPTVIYGTD